MATWVLIRNPSGVACFIVVWLMFGVRYAAALVGLMPYPQFDIAMRFALFASFGLFLFMPIIERATRTTRGCIALVSALFLLALIGHLLH